MSTGIDNKLNPLVCVCIPVYNGEKTIGFTLDDILKQDYPNLEIIVCDNMSTDRTPEIVKEYIAKSKISIRYLYNPNKGNAEANWNYMLANIDGDSEYIALYHADDLYAPAMVSKQLEALRRTGAGASFTRSRIVDEEGKDITAAINYEVDLPQEVKDEVLDFDKLFKYTLKYHNIIRTPTLFFKRDLLKTYAPLFDPAFKSSADLNAWFRIAKDKGIVTVREPLHGYRMSSTQGSFLLLKGQVEPADYFRVMDHYLEKQDHQNLKEEIKVYNSFKAIDLVKCARNLLLKGETAKAKEFLVRAARLQKFPKIFSRSGWAKGYLFGMVTLMAVYVGLGKSVVGLTRNSKRIV